MIKKIVKIKSVGIFDDFTWSSTENFKKNNGIYGFNGSGKTTLARIFRSLENGQLESKDKNTFITVEMDDGTKKDVKENEKIADILVYDEDFLFEHFKWEQGIKSFVVIGKKSKEEEEELRKLNKAKDELNTNKKIKEHEDGTVEKVILDMATEVSGELRKTLLTTSTVKYTNYKRNNFLTERGKIDVNEILNLKHIKSDIPELVKNANQGSLDLIGELKTDLKSECISNLREVLLYIQEELPTMGTRQYSTEEIGWLETGVHLHESKNECLFCENILKEGRIIEIGEVLTNKTSTFIKKGKLLINKIEKLNFNHTRLLTTQFYSESKDQVETLLYQISEFLYASALISQRVINDLNLKIEFSSGISDLNIKELMDELEAYYKIINQLNEIIKENDSKTKNISTFKSNAFRAVELIFFKDFIDRAQPYDLQLIEIRKELATIQSELEKTNTAIQKISATLQSEALAILSINKYIHLFLSRSDIQLEFNEQTSRFEIKRKNLIAKRLSEGEKTAISLCYFIILLNRDLELKKNLIVVIDDPISSLDSNNMYNAYSVLKENLQDVKQLFVLTHSLVFFRMVVRWLSEYKDNCYFRLETTNNRDKPQSSLMLMDKLTKETSTEYILLYAHLKKFIVNISEQNQMPDLDILPYPNMLRKLIETYIYTQYPGAENKDYSKALTDLGMKKETADIADRFCNDFSHGRLETVYGQDIPTLRHSPQLIKNVIEELERIDPIHFDSMKKAIA